MIFPVGDEMQETIMFEPCIESINLTNVRLAKTALFASVTCKIIKLESITLDKLFLRKITKRKKITNSDINKSDSSGQVLGSTWPSNLEFVNVDG